MVNNPGDGSLINSTINGGGSVLVALALAAPSCAALDVKDVANCFSGKTGMAVARVDERNHRLFAVALSQSPASLKQQIASASECFDNSSWSADWHVSLFTEEKYAGYNHEEKIIPHHKNNAWAEVYVGEYDGQTGGYTAYPALP
jgi:hypothetical protein